VEARSLKAPVAQTCAEVLCRALKLASKRAASVGSSGHPGRRGSVGPDSVEYSEEELQYIGRRVGLHHGIVPLLLQILNAAKDDDLTMVGSPACRGDHPLFVAC
jgi:hypothetical protein